MRGYLVKSGGRYWAHFDDDNYLEWYSNWTLVGGYTDSCGMEGYTTNDGADGYGNYIYSNLKKCVAIGKSSTTNPYLLTNNTQIWSHAGEFDSTSSPNQTNDFSSTLNSALNGGACNCSGCVLSGNNCTIPFTFHSDTAGILEYSALNITYSNPSITLISPIDSHTYGTNESLELNFTYINFTEVDCFYNIQNTTSYITSNISTDCLNTTFNVSQGEGTFNLSIYMNNSNGIMAQDSNTFSIVLDSPAINLDYPDNNSFFNSETVYFNFTATDTDGVDTCILYGDFNGTWLANETFNGIVSGTQNYTILNLQEKENLWTIWCNDSLGNEGFALENKTFTIDLTDPTMNNMTITTTTGSQTIQFLTNITDTNLDRCEYSVYNLAGGIDGSSVNVSFTCNTLSSATVSGFASYYLNVTAYDSANNSNKQGLLFTTSATSGGGTTTGGGGGTTIVTGQSDWIMTTSGDGTSYEKVMPTGTSDKLNLYFENFGEDEKDITLSCVNQEGTMCQYVSYDESTFKLPVLKEIKTQKDFTLTIPEGVDEGDYSFNIIATDEDSVQRSVTVYLSLGTKGIFQSTISKLGLSTEKGFPYIFIFLPFLLVSLVGSVIIIPEKFPTKGIWVVILTLFIPFFAIYMI